MTHFTRILAMSACLAGLGAASAQATPVPATATQSPTTLRRTALIVGDIDAILRFYQGALGMIVVDDRLKRSPETATTDDQAKSVIRIVLLRSNDDYVGQLELIHYGKPAHTPLPVVKDDQRHIGGFVMLFSTADLASVYRKAVALPGVRVLDAPHAYTYPSYGANGTTTDIIATILDPEGNWLELNQPGVTTAAKPN